MDFEGVDKQISNSIARMCQNLDPQNFDSSSMGRGRDVIFDEMVDSKCVSELLSNSVLSMSLTHFCRKLVEHHSIQFNKNTLVWPKNNI
jgi:hypothetical protein